MDSSIKVSQISAVFCIWCIILGNYALHYLKVYDVICLFFCKGRCISYHEHCADIGEENCNQCFLQTAKLHKIAFQSSSVMAVTSNLVCSERIRSNKSLTPFWRNFLSFCWGFFFSDMKSIGNCVGWMFFILALGLLFPETSLSFSVVYLVGFFFLFTLPF